MTFRAAQFHVSTAGESVESWLAEGGSGQICMVSYGVDEVDGTVKRIAKGVKS